MLIRTISLGQKETMILAKALRSYNEYSDEMIGMKTELADCIEECASQDKYDLNILCRFTEERYNETIAVVDGKEVSKR